MPSSDRARVRRRRLRLASVMLAASALGMGNGGGQITLAQETEADPATGEQLFGAYQLDARGTGVQVRYEVEGVVPGGAPVLDLTLPETLSRFGSGPVGYGLASLSYPGPLLGDIGPLLSQTGAAPEDAVPPWPIKAEVYYPTGPVTADESMGPAVQRVVGTDLGVQAHGTFPALEADPLIEIDSISSASRSTIEGESATSRSRVVLGGVRILGGLITIDSVVTDLVAVHNGDTGSTSGGTTATGVKFLGLAASLTEAGLVLEEAPPVEGPAGPLGDLLDPVLGPLNDLTAPVRDLVADTLDQTVPQVNDLLAAAGVHISILDPFEAPAETGAATRSASGISIDFTYLGREQQALAELIQSIPPDLRPSLGPIPNPISFLIANHLARVTIGAGSVSALATPPFPTLDVPPPAMDAPVGTDSFDAPALGDPGFSTAAPVLPTAPQAPEAAQLPATQPASTGASGAVPALLVALAVLATPLFAAGSSRLADTVLAPVATSCPSGLDQPPPPSRPT